MKKAEEFCYLHPMSSHHFVREGQEPALLILDPTSYADAEGLLEWAPLVVVVESALDEVLLWGIKVDVVIASPENESKLTSELSHQAPITIVSAGHDLIEASLMFMATSGQSALSIMAGGLTTSLREKVERYSGKISVTVRAPSHKWSHISSGHYKKWYHAGTILAFSNPGLLGLVSASRPNENGLELTEDQWITIENAGPFWISEQL
ncbi:MAG TPA: hypothetical protein VGD65_23670 [Chryseosolibacter sp.]